MVRTRTGDFRWGRPDAPPKELAKLAADNVLALRMAVLMLIAHESNLDLGLGDTACLGEHPRDPAEYRADSESLGKLPVLFKTPEWEYVREMLGLQLIAFNQGPLSHVRVKPTHLCTNLRLDWLTHAMAGVEGLDMSKDTSQSKEWACWAPGLVKAIAEALDEFLLEKPPKVCTLESSEERMRRHILAGHLPCWKRCRACLEGRARDRAHHRQGVVETSVLSVDLAGPFQKGNDESSPGAKYALVGVFVIADLAKLQQMEEQTNREGEEKEEEKKGEEEEEGQEGIDRFGGALGDDDWLDEHDDDDGRPDVDDAVKDAPMDGEGSYLLQSLPTKELVFTEVLPNKRHTTVLEALRRMVARIAGV